MIEIRILPMGPFQVNCHILVNPDSNEFAVVDAPMMDPVFDELLSNGLTAKWILLTHGHIDHIAALAPIKEKLNCPVAMHEGDRFLLNHVAGNPFQEILQAAPPPEPDMWLKENSPLDLGGVPVRTIHTPGHTPGSISFFISEVGVFTGDALFFESVGRTDLPGGDTAVLMESIREKLLALPGHTRVFPGHGPETTIEHEKTFNPFIR